MQCPDCSTSLRVSLAVCSANTLWQRWQTHVDSLGPEHTSACTLLMFALSFSSSRVSAELSLTFNVFLPITAVMSSVSYSQSLRAAKAASSSPRGTCFCRARPARGRLHLQSHHQSTHRHVLPCKSATQLHAWCRPSFSDAVSQPWDSLSKDVTAINDRSQHI